MYDYLIVGSGLFGVVFAHEVSKAGKSVLVIEKRDHIGGNVYTENIAGINVHKYGAHIFHTDKKDVWNYVNSFTRFEPYVNSPIAIINGEEYDLPFNMHTFSKIWPDAVTPEEAKRHIEEDKKELDGKEPSNLEEKAISMVGRTIYEKLIKGYTEKQWGRDCRDLPASIITRIPIRFTFDNNYYNDRYQGIPDGGYTKLVKKLLEGIEVRVNCDFFARKEECLSLAKKTLFTGMIDEYYDYCYGRLEYRSLRFDTRVLDMKDYQGRAVVNYTGREVDYTRIIEHKHFENNNSSLKTVITFEYPDNWTPEKEAYYVINDEKNNALAEQYRTLSKKEKNILFGGRLAEYRYYDMDDVIEQSYKLAHSELRENG